MTEVMEQILKFMSFFKTCVISLMLYLFEKGLLENDPGITKALI